MIHHRLSPIRIVFLLWVLFGALLATTYDQWPAQVATHFDFAGKPNGWMSREGNLVAHVCLAVGMPLLIYGIFSLTSIFPTQLINLPRRDYWLAPERRNDTLRELRRQSLWLGCLVILFAGGLYVVTLLANQDAPPRLDPRGVLLVLGGFLLGLAIWVTSLLRRFAKDSGIE